VKKLEEDRSIFLVLDDTLRYLYITLRNRNAILVAIEFIHEGKHWKADTPGEAIRLRKQLELDTYYQKQEGARWEETLAHPWTPEVFNTFVTTVGEQQNRVVLFLAEHACANSSELRIHLRLENEMALAGVMSGLSKQLKRIGLKPEDLYQVNTSWKGKKKERVFMILDSFRYAAGGSEWLKQTEKGEKMPPPPRQVQNSKTR
jgi:hypothetical protein